jgi:hypothetical protein
MILFSCLLWQSSALAVISYQDFELDNGTPPKPDASSLQEPAQYGWGFNGAMASLSKEGEPVHWGSRSWKVTVPSGPHVIAGTGIPSQIQTYHMNFVPQCHDRLTFWIWSDSSQVGDHTVMVKFFDQQKYKYQGIGVWTQNKAQYQQWSRMEILFSQLPADFDLEHVDKIEFFNYWDGTYFYDDIQVTSSSTKDQDQACLEKELVVVCSPIDAKKEHCHSVYGKQGDEVLQFLGLKIHDR